MKSLMIKDLAEVIVEEYCPRINVDPNSIDFKYIGARPGEKMYELLMSDEETVYAQDLGDRFVIKKNGKPNNENSVDKSSYRSNHNPKLSKDEIRKMILDLNLLN